MLFKYIFLMALSVWERNMIKFVEYNTTRPYNQENSAKEFDEVDIGTLTPRSGICNKAYNNKEADIHIQEDKPYDNMNQNLAYEEKRMPVKSKTKVKITIPILLGVVFLLFVVSPIVVAYSLTELRHSRTAYIYYNDPNEFNKTTITQVTLMKYAIMVFVFV